MVSESLLEQLISNRATYMEYGLNADLLRALMVSLDDYYELALKGDRYEVTMAYYHAMGGIRAVFLNLSAVLTEEQRTEFLDHLTLSQSLVHSLALDHLLSK